MKEYKYKVDNENVKGSVIMKIPSFSDRLRFAKEMGISAGAEFTDLDQIVNMFESMGKYVLSVDIKIDGEKINDLEELGMYQDGVKVITEIASIITGGIPGPKPVTPPQA